MCLRLMMQRDSVAKLDYIICGWSLKGLLDFSHDASPSGLVQAILSFSPSFIPFLCVDSLRL